MMQALRRPAMPWQLPYLDVAGELTDDGTRLAYPYVVVIVPRRAGKTAAMLAGMLQRCATGPARNAYTAQTRGDAAKALREDWSPMLDAARLTPHRVKVRRSQGSESLTWVRTGGALTLFSPTERAVHGSDVDVAVVDEAWSFTAEQGDVIEAALQPAQATRTATRQTWIVSAGGTHASTWLARWRDLGRAQTPGVALIEYGADPEVDDLDDPAVWSRVHPAVGHTIDLDTLASIRDTMPRDEFHRAFLGVWTALVRGTPRLPRELWDAAGDPAAAPTTGIAYGIEAAADASSATIVAAGRWVDDLGRERLAVEVVEHLPGTAWVPAVWRKLRARTRGRLYADALGPTVAVVDELRRQRLPVEVLTTGAYTGACQAILDDLTPVDGAPTLAHRSQPILDAAAGRAQARSVGDRWVWQRRGEVDASPVIAATLAAAGARNPVRRPFVRVAG